MEYSGFIFAAFVALVGIIIAVFVFFQDWREAYRKLRTHAY